MRGIVWLVTFIAVKAFASVEIPAPRVQSLAADRVLQACGGHSSIGCTQFTDVALICDCVQEPDGWRVYAAARAIPSVYITEVSWLHHELLHISDFRQYLKAHTRALTSARFATREACDRLADAAIAAFPDTMQRITRLSAGRRDRNGPVSSEDHLVVVQAKVMPELVNDRLAHLSNDLPAAARHAENRSAKDRNLIGERREHVERPLRKSDAAVDAKQLVVGRFVTEEIAVLISRLFFHNDDNVVEKPRELVRQLFESLFDELLELRSA